ncbi:MAG: hypothetical protein IT365_19130 [Candidatus Hydrogenedentes bacterium]|nr:hypothetical protein [Candidatus Hydrogenedentota bacterium]
MKSKSLPMMAATAFDLCSFLEPLAPLFSLIEQILAFFGVEIDILGLLGCGEEETP